MEDVERIGLDRTKGVSRDVREMIERRLGRWRDFPRSTVRILA